MLSMVDLGPPPCRILMVDDHMMFLQAVRSLMQDKLPGVEIDVAETFAEAVAAVGRVRHELVLLDWHLADIHGTRTIELLQEAGCRSRIVYLSGDVSAENIQKGLDAGAVGFIPKTYRFELLIAALGLVLQGGVFLPPEVLGHPQRAAGAHAPAAPPAPPSDAVALVDLETRFPSLTSRQLDVFRAAAKGLSNKLIARELGIAESTVKTHLSVVFAELGVSNRTQAVLQASKEGFRVV